MDNKGTSEHIKNVGEISGRGCDEVGHCEPCPVWGTDKGCMVDCPDAELAERDDRGPGFYGSMTKEVEQRRKEIEMEKAEKAKRMEMENKPIDATFTAQSLKDAINRCEREFGITVRESLQVHLSEREINDRARLASEKSGEIEALQDKLKGISSKIKDDIKTAMGEMRAASRAANTGREYQKVECQQHFDLKNGTTWFTYRGETYDQRQMSPYEQREAENRGLFGDGPILPNKVNIDEMKSPKDLGGDVLAKRLDEDNLKAFGEAMSSTNSGEKVAARAQEIKSFNKAEEKASVSEEKKKRARKPKAGIVTSSAFHGDIAESNSGEDGNE